MNLVPPSLYDAFWKPLSVQDDLVTNDPEQQHPEGSSSTKRFNEYLAPFQAMLTAKITTNFSVLTGSVDAGNTTLAWNTWGSYVESCAADFLARFPSPIPCRCQIS